MTHLELATWLLSGRFTAAAPGATEFLGDAIASYERGRDAVGETSAPALFLGILWKLALVVVLIWVTVWVLRRAMRPGAMPMSGEAPIRVLASSHLDARHAVYLVEVGRRLLALGVGADSVNVLAEFKDPGEQEAIRDQLKAPDRSGFTSAFASWTSRLGSRTGKGRELREAAGFFSERLRSLRRQRERDS